MNTHEGITEKPVSKWGLEEEFHRSLELIVFRLGRRVVQTTTGGSRFSSRLYVNSGETATSTTAKHATREGARRWAIRMLTEAQNNVYSA
jgi:hypothetical protein